MSVNRLGDNPISTVHGNLVDRLALRKWPRYGGGGGGGREKRGREGQANELGGCGIHRATETEQPATPGSCQRSFWTGQSAITSVSCLF